jgi:transposase-like protein
MAEQQTPKAMIRDLVEACVKHAGSACRLAQRLGVEPSTVGRWRRGAGVRWDSIEKLEEYQRQDMRAGA